MRLDNYLVEHKLYTSRSKAKDAIVNNCIMINNNIVTKAGYIVKKDDDISVVQTHNPYVSKGGLKLEKALSFYQVDFKDKTICDIGSSTGGFTDCALTHGAKRVYAIDIGSNQLDDTLRNNKNVISLENMNFLDLGSLPEPIDYFVSDVSFISVIPIIHHICEYFPNTELICLIKPQFESKNKSVGKKGVIRNKKEHIQLLNDVLHTIYQSDFSVKEFTYSPITGSNGNIEFLVHLGFGKNNYVDVKKVVEEAHKQLSR